MAHLQNFKFSSYRIFQSGILILFISLVINLHRCSGKAVNLFTPLTSARFSDSCQQICISPVCLREAIHFSYIMNEEVDPCDDFYQFVCGNFLNQTRILDQMTVDNAFSTAQILLSAEIYEEILREIEPTDLEAFKKTKIFYRNCMNQAKVEEQGMEPLLEILEKTGGFPLLMGDKWNEMEFDWRNTIYKIKDLDFFVTFPVAVSIDIDYKNSSKYMIKIQDSITTISPMFLLKDSENKLLKAYYDYMVNVTVTLGANKTAALREMKKVLDFEIDLYNIKTLPEDLLNVTEADNQLTIKELSKKHPSIPWLNLLNKLFNPSGIFVNDTETVFVTDLDYLPKLENLLKVTPKRVLANYLSWYLIQTTLLYMPEKLREAIMNFNSIVEGTKKPMNRESWCLNEIMEAFPIAISAMYVRKHFNAQIKENVTELVENMKNQSRRRLQEVDWMDDETRKAALEKLDAMDISVGYADELMDDKKVDDYYKELEINSGSYLRGTFNLSTFLIKKNYKVLRRPVEKNLWTLSHNSAVVNAYYIPQKNTIEIPAGFLRSFFQSERPNYLNYGLIGTIIGHEITHGFDNQGRKHDKYGNQKNWWLPSTEEKFFQKAHCFIDQYDNFTVDEVGLKVNGARTQGENIADNAGFKTAYYAYTDWASRNNVVEPCLPALDYTPRQMFWISAASIWCTKHRPEYLRDLISSDPHSPENARIILSFSNIKEFADDFHCKTGTRMNPENKCVIW